MKRSRLSWMGVLGLVVILALIVVVFCVRFFTTDWDTMPESVTTVDEVVEITADVNGSIHGLPTLGEFMVPREFHALVFRYFSGPSHRWSPRHPDVMDRFKLGRIRCRLRDGRTQEIDFYTAGKGVIGYSIGRNFWLADTPGDDGAMSLVFVLEEAKKKGSKGVGGAQ